MDGNSAASTAPSPSHSASASVCSSAHKRKNNNSSDELLLPTAAFPPFSLSDAALTSNDDLDSISAKHPADDDDDDDDSDDDSMRLFTASRLDPNSSSTANGGGNGGGGGNSNPRNVKPKVEGSVAKVESDAGKDERGPRAAAAGVSSLSGIVVKEDSVKSIFTDNIQTSGAYCAREENLKREV